MSQRNTVQRRTQDAMEIARRTYRERLTAAQQSTLIEATLARNPRMSEESRNVARSEIRAAIAHERVCAHIDRIARHVQASAPAARFHHALLSACRFVKAYGIRRLAEWQDKPAKEKTR
jgi:hypothetical protein